MHGVIDIMPPLKVLIAEDDLLSQRMLVDMIKDAGITDVHTANSGAQVLSKIDSQLKPDILLCDLLMPGVDGIDLLRLLGERNFKGEIIIISGCDRRIINAACNVALHYQLRLAGSIEKPVDVNKLMRMLRYWGEMKRGAPVVDEGLTFSRD